MPPREWPRSTTFCNCKCCTKSTMSLPDCYENSVGETSPIANGKPFFFHQNLHSPSHQIPPISGHQSEARCHHAHRRPSARSWRAHMGQSRSSQSSWNSHDCGRTVQPKRWKALPNAFPVVQTHWHAMNPASGWKEWSHKSESASMPCPIVSLKTFRCTFGQDNVGATPTTIHSRAESCNSASRCLRIARLDLGKTLQRVAWQGSASFKKTYFSISPKRILMIQREDHGARATCTSIISEWDTR